MTNVEKLKNDFLFEESVLVSVETQNLVDVALEIRVYEENLTVQFSGELEAVAPGGFLSIVCRNVARFELNRLRHGRPDLLLVKVPVPDVEGAEDGPRTIFGFHFRDDSEWLRELGPAREHFHHLVIDTVDARLSILFEELVLPLWP
jgi:hypothetical protein